MSVLWIVLAIVAAQRLAELVYARRNARRLLDRGGVEAGASHYPLVVLLHAAWLTSMAVVVPPQTQPNWWLLALYALLQPLRLWTIASLGPYWTTRIVTLDGAPLVTSGPYRYLRHPNYAVVCAEIAILPLAFGAFGVAVVFSILNAALLWHRVRVEERAIEGRRLLGGQGSREMKRSRLVPVLLLLAFVGLSMLLSARFALGQPSLYWLVGIACVCAMLAIAALEEKSEE